MPMTALSLLGGQFRLKAQARSQLYQDFLPWAVRAGFRSADLMCLYYEQHFEVCHVGLGYMDRGLTGCLKAFMVLSDSNCYLQDNLEDLRRQWRIEVAPVQARKSKVQL